MILKNYIIQARFSKNKQSHTLTKNITLLLKIPFSIVIFIVFSNTLYFTHTDNLYFVP